MPGLWCLPAPVFLSVTHTCYRWDKLKWGHMRIFDVGTANACICWVVARYVWTIEWVKGGHVDQWRTLKLPVFYQQLLKLNRFEYTHTYTCMGGIFKVLFPVCYRILETQTNWCYTNKQKRDILFLVERSRRSAFFLPPLRYELVKTGSNSIFCLHFLSGLSHMFPEEVTAWVLSV